MIAEVYEVEGVHCPRCIEKIAAALADIDGLLAADANLMGEITVRLDGPEAARARAARRSPGSASPSPPCGRVAVPGASRSDHETTPRTGVRR